jgi:hypothetical protein
MRVIRLQAREIECEDETSLHASNKIDRLLKKGNNGICRHINPLFLHRKAVVRFNVVVSPTHVTQSAPTKGNVDLRFDEVFDLSNRPWERLRMSVEDCRDQFLFVLQDQD